ncbi:MAG: hypothetical protein VX619_01430, partial [bacterium]|nr:hypothetical protein [bacterium]
MYVLNSDSMFKQFKQVFISFFTLSFAIFFIGCGGSGVSDPLNTSDFGQTPSPSISTVLNGSVIKGPVSGATVRAYRVVNGVKAQELGTAMTAADGSYRLSVVGYDGPIVIEAFNGQYTDEATGIKKVLNRSMNSIVPKFTATKPAMVSPLTHMAAAIVSQSSDISETSIQDAIDEVSEFYSLSDILITTPSIITDSTVSVSEVESNQLNYGLILSAISQIGADENTDPLEIMDIIAQDASDGSFDGQNNGQTLTLNNKEVSQSFATKDIADSISTIVESLSSQLIVSVDPEFLFNLETTEGVIEKSSVKLSVKALPKLTGSNNIQLTGLATPGTSSIEIIQNDIKISEFFTGLDGTFSVQIGLIVNQLNQVTVRARNGGAVSERNIEIRQDSIPPSFSFLTTEPEYINSESVFLAYDLTDTYGGPADLTVSLSQGNALVNSNTIQLSNLVEGTQLLQLELFDQLNNRISQSYPLFVDFSAPILETTVPSLVNTN